MSITTPMGGLGAHILAPVRHCSLALQHTRQNRDFRQKKTPQVISNFPPILAHTLPDAGVRQFEVVLAVVNEGAVRARRGLLPFALGYATSYISFSPALYIAFIGAMSIMVGLYFYHLPESRQLNRVI